MDEQVQESAGAVQVALEVDGGQPPSLPCKFRGTIFLYLRSTSPDFSSLSLFSTCLRLIACALESEAHSGAASASRRPDRLLQRSSIVRAGEFLPYGIPQARSTPAAIFACYSSQLESPRPPFVSVSLVHSTDIMATPSPAASEGKGAKEDYDAGIHRSSSSGEEAAELIDPAQEKKLLRKMCVVAAVEP